MKLKIKFSFLSLGLVFMLFCLSASLVFVSNRIITLKDYGSRLTEAKYDVADISDFINTILYHSATFETFVDEWNFRLTRIQSDFSVLQNQQIRNLLTEDLFDRIQRLESFWMILSARFSSFDTHLNAISVLNLDPLTISQFKSQGILMSWQLNESISSIGGLSFEILVVQSELRSMAYAKESMDGSMVETLELFNKWVNDQFRLSLMIIFAIVIIACILLWIIVSTLSHNIVKRVKTLDGVSDGLAQKNLTVSSAVFGHDEISNLMRNLNTTIAQLNEFILVVKKNASHVLSSGFQINNSIEETAAAINQIDRNISSMTVQFDQLGNSVNSATGAIKAVDNLVLTLVDNNNNQSQAIGESNSAIMEMAKSIESINTDARARMQSVQEMQGLITDGDSKISSTGESLARITSQLDDVLEVVTIINSIAQQTNMLAMNAAIEAAHAGDAGKGFGVVADEIRKLAESTSDNAKQISSSVNGIVERVKDANDSSSVAAASFEKISESAKEMLKSFTDITRGIENIDEKTHQISSHTKEISQTAETINGYCTELAEQQDSMTKEMSMISNIYHQAVNGISEIKYGTDNIVQMTHTVSEQSNSSYKMIEDLQHSLSEFTTKDKSEADDAEVVSTEDSENSIKDSTSSDSEGLEELTEEQKDMEVTEEKPLE